MSCVKFWTPDYTYLCYTPNRLLPVSLPPALIPLVLAIPMPLRHVQFPLTSFSFCHDFIFFCQGLVKFGHQTRQLFLQILANRTPNKGTNVATQFYKISRFPCLQTDSHSSLPCAFTMAVTSLCLSLAFSRVSAASCETDPETWLAHSHPPLRTCLLRPMILILKGLELDSGN